MQLDQQKAISPRTIVVGAGSVIVHVVEAGRAVRQVVVVTISAAPAGKCRGGDEGRRRVVVRGGRGSDSSQSLGGVGVDAERCVRGEGGERERRGSGHRRWAEAEHHLGLPREIERAIDANCQK